MSTYLHSYRGLFKCILQFPRSFNTLCFLQKGTKTVYNIWTIKYQGTCINIFGLHNIILNLLTQIHRSSNTKGQTGNEAHLECVLFVWASHSPTLLFVWPFKNQHPILTFSDYRFRIPDVSFALCVRETWSYCSAPPCYVCQSLVKHRCTADTLFSSSQITHKDYQALFSVISILSL